MAAGLCLLLAGCESANPKKPALRSFIPPQIRRVFEPSRETLTPEIPIPAVPPAGAAVVPKATLPPRPSNPEFLMQRAERLFADGKRAVQEGRTRDARRSFDAAIQALMSEPLPEDVIERRRIEERLDDMADAIYHYDLEQLGAGLANPQPEEAAAPPPVEKQILETNLPVNPGLRDRVREQIETTMSELPLEVTDPVLGYIDYFSTDRGRRVLLSGFARAGRYRDMILRVFHEEGLPEELIFVAQLESHFNPSAVSYASAVGMWQFMRTAGTEYDLSINALLDERRDPERATRAAAQFLLALYRRYGDWYLALAAYNCGAGCVDRAIQRTGFADFWELRRLHALPLATTNYVPEILAMTIMYKNAAAYGIEVEPDPLLEYDNVLLEADTSLSLVAAAVDRPVGQIKQLNPALTQTLAPRGYALHLPVGAVDPLKDAFKAVPPVHRKSARVHRVEDGDTWASIAKKYGTTPARLVSLNDEELPEPGALRDDPAGSSACSTEAGKEDHGKEEAGRSQEARGPGVPLGPGAIPA
ncbi:MAG: transglycosylase SLT domain-containing protein [Acidobacteriota bacterium]